ncbi:MAG: hypothetical protein JNK82_16780, partial [Myxococcaceae bacterium]|nr:hypothetical protein [Myxococcaceae bacterium]
MIRFSALSLSLFVLSTCSSGGPTDFCVANRVTCEAGLNCDPDDGVCKCGGRGGVVCPENFRSDADSITCQSSRCLGVDCSSRPGTSCDVFDGKCKCGGTGGDECASAEVCEPASKRCQPLVNCNDRACSRNQTCDVQTGQCKCGTATCEPDQFCAIGADMAKTCTESICNGVHCAGANVCDTNDGYCKCNGAICQSGEACACPPGADGGQCPDAQRACRTGSACVGVTCNGGTTCDPVDGQCKCGGPGGPACAPNQVCALGPTPQCQGGAQCVLPDGGARV